MDCSYKKLRALLQELIYLRKNIPQAISDIHRKENKQILEYLDNVKISLRENYEYDFVINTSNPFESLKVQQLDNGLLEKIYEQIQLLQILIKKKDCPISKIIDDI